MCAALSFLLEHQPSHHILGKVTNGPNSHKAGAVLKNVVHPLYLLPPFQPQMTFPGILSGQTSSLLALTAFPLRWSHWLFSHLWCLTLHFCCWPECIHCLAKKSSRSCYFSFTLCVSINFMPCGNVVMVGGYAHRGAELSSEGDR